MGSYPRCAPRLGRCEGRQGVVCARVCLAEASVGLIGGCVRSCQLSPELAIAGVSYRIGRQSSPVVRGFDFLDDWMIRGEMSNALPKLFVRNLKNNSRFISRFDNWGF